MTNQINELQPVESSRDIEDKYREELLTFFSSGIFLFDNSATHSAPSNMPKDDENMRNIANGAVTSVEAVKNDPIKLQNALTEYYSNDKLKKMTKRLFDTIDSYHKAEFDSQIKDLQIQSLQVPSSPSKKLPQVENSPTYQAYIEQLQFISLDKKFDRAAMITNESEGEKIAQAVQDFIQSLDTSRHPKAVFHLNYVRKGTIFEEGEVGILLDNIAIDILVKETLRMITELSIRQAKGYMYIDHVNVDYNDSTKMMRIKRNPESISEIAESDYAVYFYAK